jgi:pantoate--beta-alanine ligase
MREPDGLAMSSRNRYLSESGREQATSLIRALRRAQALIAAGERDPAAIETALRNVLNSAGPCAIDYASVVDAENLQPVRRIDSPVLLALAVRIGGTRLIDNLTVDPAAPDR